MALATWLQRLRPLSAEEQHTQRVFRGQVLDCATRVRQLLTDWEALREIESDYARLANAAAVSRWELLRLVQRTETEPPPRPLQDAQRQLLSQLLTAARACQLLANGYRSGKSEAICDGQALLLDSVQSLESLVNAVEFR
jgi:hypothetical protein